MEWIVDIEKPFHSLPFSQPAVISVKKRKRKNDGQLDEPVGDVEKDSVPCGVQGHRNRDSQHLLLKISPVEPHKQDGHRRGGAPVRRQRNKDASDDQQPFDCFCHPRVFAFCHSQCDQAPHQRPDDAGLAEDHSVLKGDEGAAETKGIGKVGQDGKQEHPLDIPPQVFRIMIPLRNKEKHDGRRHSADAVQKDRQGRLVEAGHKRPCQVIDSHGNDCNEFQGIGIEPDFIFFALDHLAVHGALLLYS